MIIHFFKAKTRLGLPNRPINQIEENLGVEDAPEAILTPDFLSNFPGYQISEFIFPNPEDVKSSYWTTLASKLEEFKNFINRNLKPGQRQIVIGGENSITFSSLLADFERLKNKTIGYIQFDSHGESNSLRHSPSNNFHGMYMRPFFDKFDLPIIDSLVSQRLTKQDCLFIGNLDLDGDEPKLFKSMGFRNISGQEIDKNRQKVLQEVEQFVKKFDHIHINFDVDVFDKSLVLSTGIPSQNGLNENQVFPLLEIISRHPDISIDLSELNPRKPGSLDAIELGQKVLKVLAFCKS